MPTKIRPFMKPSRGLHGLRGWRASKNFTRAPSGYIISAVMAKKIFYKRVNVEQREGSCLRNVRVRPEPIPICTRWHGILILQRAMPRSVRRKSGVFPSRRKYKAEAHAIRSERLHLPDASGRPAIQAGFLPEVWHGA